MWDAAQCCEYISKRRGRSFAQSTWRDYVSDGRAPAPLPWAMPTRNGPARKLWDSAAVVDFEDTRPGVGHPVDTDGWVAARVSESAVDTADGLEFWRGPQTTVAATDVTAALAEAGQWQGKVRVEKALAEAFGPGGRWKQTPKWGGFVPMRVAGAALVVNASGLPERDQQILRRRAEGGTLRAVGAEFGMTGERVRQIERDAAGSA
jgi:hypothetical protein